MDNLPGCLGLRRIKQKSTAEMHLRRVGVSGEWTTAEIPVKSMESQVISPLMENKKGNGEKYNKEGRNSLCLLSIHHIYAFYSGEWCLFPLMGTSSVREFSKGNLKALVVN